LQLSAEHALGLVTGYFATLILARELGPEAFGLYGIILSVLAWAETTGQFGVPSAATRLIAEGREEKDAVGRTTLVLGFVSYLSVFVFFLLAAPLFARALNAPGEAGLFRLAAFDIPLFGIYFVLRGVGLGQRKFGTIALGGLAVGFAKLLGVLLLLAVGVTVARALVVVIASSLLGLLILTARIPIRVARPDRRLLRVLVRIAIPLALSALALSFLHNVHLWILKSLSGEGAKGSVGVYIAGAHLAKAPEIIVIAVGAVLFPSISRAIADGDDAGALAYVQGAVRFLWLVLLPIALFVALDAERIMTFLFSAKYSGGGEVLRVLIFAYALLAFLVSFSHMLLGRGEFYLVALLGFGLLAVMVGTGMILVPRAGGVGAAFSLLAATSVGAALYAFLVRRRFGGLILRRTFLRGILASLAALALALLVRVDGILLVPKYAVVFAVYLVVLALTREIKEKDLAALLFWK
jgi:O-antigen/teichoic acid export membrane protein